MNYNQMMSSNSRIPEGDEWKVACAKELVEVKNGILSVDLLMTKEMDQILEVVVT